MFTESFCRATPDTGIILPKKSLGNMERKNKASYCLTRKEYEDFTTYMCYFLYNMVEPTSTTVEYKQALFYVNEKHNMHSLKTDADSFHMDENVFTLWSKTCDAAESYLTQNINMVFKTYYKHKTKLTTAEHANLKEQLTLNIINKQFNVKPLDGWFAPSNMSSANERLQNNFSSEDLRDSGTFILWQAVRGLLFYTITNNDSSLIDSEQAKQLMFRLVDLMYGLEDDEALPDFMALLPYMWV